MAALPGIAIPRYQEGYAAMKSLLRLVRHCRGATAIEYGLIAALIAVAAIAAMQGLGYKLGSTFGRVDTSMQPS